jgi:hypothetical protein
VQTSRQAQIAAAIARYLTSLMPVILIAFAAGALTACGGGSGADETLAGQCYVAGVPADAAACSSKSTALPVACSASSGCRS